MLVQLSAVPDYLCAVWLKAALPQWLLWLNQRVSLTPAQERQLPAISPLQNHRVYVASSPTEPGGGWSNLVDRSEWAHSG